MSTGKFNLDFREVVPILVCARENVRHKTVVGLPRQRPGDHPGMQRVAAVLDLRHQTSAMIA